MWPVPKKFTSTLCQTVMHRSSYFTTGLATTEPNSPRSALRTYIHANDGSSSDWRRRADWRLSRAASAAAPDRTARASPHSSVLTCGAAGGGWRGPQAARPDGREPGRVPAEVNSHGRVRQVRSGTTRRDFLLSFIDNMRSGGLMKYRKIHRYIFTRLSYTHCSCHTT